MQLTDHEYNSYMNKFKNRYAVRIDEDNVRILENKQGKIAPYWPEKRLLGVWCINLTPKKKTWLLKRLNPFLIETHQNCHSEFGAYFNEMNLDAICKIMKIKKRRQLTDDQHAKLAAQAKINFNLN